MTGELDPARPLTISEVAARRVKAIIEAESLTGAFLRISLKRRGGTRPAHTVALDDELSDTDVVFEDRGVRLVVDGLLLSLVAGAHVDYVERGTERYFTVSNPNLVPLALGQAASRRRRGEEPEGGRRPRS